MPPPPFFLYAACEKGGHELPLHFAPVGVQGAHVLFQPFFARFESARRRVPERTTTFMNLYVRNVGIRGLGSFCALSFAWNFPEASTVRTHFQDPIKFIYRYLHGVFELHSSKREI